MPDLAEESLKVWPELETFDVTGLELRRRI